MWNLRGWAEPRARARGSPLSVVWPATVLRTPAPLDRVVNACTHRDPRGGVGSQLSGLPPQCPSLPHSGICQLLLLSSGCECLRLVTGSETARPGPGCRWGVAIRGASCGSRAGPAGVGQLPGAGGGPLRDELWKQHWVGRGSRPRDPSRRRLQWDMWPSSHGLAQGGRGWGVG